MYRDGRKLKFDKPYEGKIEPFRLAGNIYFVGTIQASSHLIDTGDGLILLDTGYENTLYLVIESIRKLGFDPYDIKYIINTHWHWDHTAASGMMADLTGAKNIIGKEDADYVVEKGYFIPDITVSDGDVISLGNTKIECMHTPGHTKGTYSFFMDVTHGGKTYRAGTFGGAGLNSLVPEFATYYEGCREDYRNSINRLLGEKVDIFIGNHCWNNDTDGKGKKVLGGEADAFIDDREWGKFLNSRLERLNELEKR